MEKGETKGRYRGTKGKQVILQEKKMKKVEIKKRVRGETRDRT